MIKRNTAKGWWINPLAANRTISLTANGIHLAQEDFFSVYTEKTKSVIITIFNCIAEPTCQFMEKKNKILEILLRAPIVLLYRIVKIMCIRVAIRTWEFLINT